MRDPHKEPERMGVSQRRTAAAEVDRGWSKLMETPMIETVMIETVRFENWLQTRWKAVAEEEMSGNAGRLQFEKQEDKHQGWARICVVLEEEGSRVWLSLWPDTSPSHAVKSLLLSIFLQRDFRLKRKIDTAFKRNRSWCYLNSFSRHLPSSALAQTGLFHLVCISSSLNWSSVHVIHFLWQKTSWAISSISLCLSVPLFFGCAGDNGISSASVGHQHRLLHSGCTEHVGWDPSRGPRVPL